MIASVWWATGRSEAVDEMRARSTWTHVVDMAHQVTAAGLDELNVVVAEALRDPSSDGPTSPESMVAAEHRVAAVAAARAGLTDLADDPVVGPTARSLALLYSEFPADVDTYLDPADVIDLLEEGVAVLEAAAAADPVVVGLAQLVDQSTLPRYVLNDALDVASLDAAAPEWAQEYFTDSDDYVRSGRAGWLDGSPSAPLSSPYIADAVLISELPGVWTEMAHIGQAPATAPLVVFDAWVSDWTSHQGAAPPVDLPSLRASSADTASRIDTLVADTIVATRLTAESMARSRDQVRWAVAIGGLALAGLALLLALLALRRQSSHARTWQRAALVDQLTGVPNRRGLHAHAAEVKGPERDGHALLLYDLDHFKGINDGFGHAVGDDALKLVATRSLAVAEAIPGTAVVARLGGDEFVILAHDLADPGTDAAKAASALVDAVTARPLSTADGEVPLSVSVGIATAVGPLDLEDLLMKADIALYDVKRSGRGAHRTYTPTGT